MSFREKRLPEIARGTGLSEEETQRYLDSMTDKGVIVSRLMEKGMGFRLIPTAQGLCEHSLQKACENPLHARLRDLWKQYRDDGMIVSMTNNQEPIMRVLPIETALPDRSHILSHEAVSNLINASVTIAVYNCGCRITERHCDAPVETCFVFDSTADFLVDRSFARKIEPKEALSILDATERAGLVHIGNNSADKAVSICNCCSCCCLFLRGLLEFGNSHAVAASSYVASVREELCIDCGICSNGRCRVGAMMARDGQVQVQGTKCLGCGLCVSTCPTEAIELKSREIPPETPPTIQDLGLKILTEKGKLNAFMEILMK
jgi:Pyruvate/2-oxoacid:ferredoxin oxidoreductase delta subunit